MVNCHLQTNLAQGDPRPPERMKTSREFVNWSWKTVAEQLTILLICLVCPGVPANGFWARNCKWKELQLKFVTHVLTPDQKQSWVDACRELKEHLEIDPDSFWRSLLVTKAGATPTTQRRSSSQANGKVQIHHVPKKRGEWSQMSRRCWFYFIQTSLFTQNSFLSVKLLTRRFTYKFWNVCMTRWDKNTPSCGKVGSGSFTTTTHQRTKPGVWNNF